MKNLQTFDVVTIKEARNIIFQNLVLDVMLDGVVKDSIEAGLEMKNWNQEDEVTVGVYEDLVRIEL